MFKASLKLVNVTADTLREKQSTSTAVFLLHHLPQLNKVRKDVPRDLKADWFDVELLHVTASTTTPVFARWTKKLSNN